MLGCLVVPGADKLDLTPLFTTYPLREVSKAKLNRFIMKKILLTPLVVISAFVTSFSQTTQEDYNYATSGYKDDLSKGRKPEVSGYNVFNLYNRKVNWAGGDYGTAWVKELYRKGENTLAAYIVVYQLKDKGNNLEYVCIPHPNSGGDIQNQFIQSLSSATDNKYTIKLTTILYAISGKLKW